MKEKNLNDLYKEVILAHSKSPYHFEKKDAPFQEVEAYNPLCGDQYQLFIQSPGQILSEVYFHGYGCAISKASGSVMLQELEGLSFREAETLIQNFLRIMNPELAETNMEVLPSGLHAFARVREFPARFSCVSLIWKSMLEFIRGQK